MKTIKSQNELENKLLKKFLIINFGLVFILGICIYFAKKQDFPLSNFAALQMYFPALAAIISILTTEVDVDKIAKRSYLTYIALTFVFVINLISNFVFKNVDFSNIIFIVSSLVLIVVFILEDKTKKDKSNLRIYSLKSNLLTLLIFVIIYFFAASLATLVTEGFETLKGLFSIKKLIIPLILLINFPLSFLPFWGEEYGWRFFLQPILQKKYGMRNGLIFLGLIWGIWHLPLNLFFYAAKGSELISIVNQLVGCIALAIIMGYAYTKTKSVWTVSLIHYFNNNLILFFADNLDPSIIENRVLNWNDFFMTVGITIVLYGAFLFTKHNTDSAYRIPTALERLAED